MTKTIKNREEAVAAIDEYFAKGGNVNPELMDPEKVRGLLGDLRDWLGFLNPPPPISEPVRHSTHHGIPPNPPKTKVIRLTMQEFNKLDERERNKLVRGEYLPQFAGRESFEYCPLPNPGKYFYVIEEEDVVSKEDVQSPPPPLTPNTANFMEDVPMPPKLKGIETLRLTIEEFNELEEWEKTKVFKGEILPGYANRVGVREWAPKLAYGKVLYIVEEEVESPEEKRLRIMEKDIEYLHKKRTDDLINDDGYSQRIIQLQRETRGLLTFGMWLAGIFAIFVLLWVLDRSFIRGSLKALNSATHSHMVDIENLKTNFVPVTIKKY